MNAQVYVGTYGKYAAGSIRGAWIDLEECGDHETFIAKAKDLHKDEPDPELMFQDFDGFPRGYYNESHIDPAVFEWLEMDEQDRELLEIYQECVDEKGTLEEAQDAYIGQTDGSEADFAAEWYEESGQLEGVPEHIQRYIDYDAIARDMRCDGMIFHRHNGTLYVFSN